MASAFAVSVGGLFWHVFEFREVVCNPFYINVTYI